MWRQFSKISHLAVSENFLWEIILNFLQPSDGAVEVSLDGRRVLVQKSIGAGVDEGSRGGRAGA